MNCAYESEAISSRPCCLGLKRRTKSTLDLVCLTVMQWQVHWQRLAASRRLYQILHFLSSDDLPVSGCRSLQQTLDLLNHVSPLETAGIARDGFLSNRILYIWIRKSSMAPLVALAMRYVRWISPRLCN
jgi:hypothetical protein